MIEAEKTIYINAMHRLKKCETKDEYKKLLKYAIRIDNNFIVKYIIENIFVEYTLDELLIIRNIHHSKINCPKIMKYMEKYNLHEVENNICILTYASFHDPKQYLNNYINTINKIK